MADGIENYFLTPHAQFEMRRRGIGEEIVKKVLAAPEQRMIVRTGREVFQSRMTMAGKTYLVRIFVDVDRRPAEVVTLYRTSKLFKYWRNGP